VQRAPSCPLSGHGFKNSDVTIYDEHMSEQITLSKQALEKILEEISESKQLAETQLKTCQTQK